MIVYFAPLHVQTTRSHYVYVMTFGDDGKIKSMTKIWNAPWAMKELGWM
jgi:hypothetical protein